MRGGRRVPEGASFITIRVSRDGGHTYSSPAALATPHDDPVNPDPLMQLRRYSSAWPPCQCPRHRAAPGTIPDPR
jgi:hypothetical protein